MIELGAMDDARKLLKDFLERMVDPPLWYVHDPGRRRLRGDAVDLAAVLLLRSGDSVRVEGLTALHPLLAARDGDAIYSGFVSALRQDHFFAAVALAELMYTEFSEAELTVRALDELHEALSGTDPSNRYGVRSNPWWGIWKDGARSKLLELTREPIDPQSSRGARPTQQQELEQLIQEMVATSDSEGDRLWEALHELSSSYRDQGRDRDVIHLLAPRLEEVNSWEGRDSIELAVLRDLAQAACGVLHRSSSGWREVPGVGDESERRMVLRELSRARAELETDGDAWNGLAFDLAYALYCCADLAPEHVASSRDVLSALRARHGYRLKELGELRLKCFWLWRRVR